MNSFKVQELKRPSISHKLFGIQPKFNAIIEINNLFADKGIKGGCIEDIQQVADTNKVKLHKKYNSEILGVCRIYEPRQKIKLKLPLAF